MRASMSVVRKRRRNSRALNAAVIRGAGEDWCAVNVDTSCIGVDSGMNEKKSSRLRRARRGRMKMRELGTVRLSVNRTPRHIYAQVIAADGSQILAQASTLETALRSGPTGNVATAEKVGKLIAERAKEAGITSVAFDRSGFKYHGRVKALADAAREGGLEF